VFLRLITNPRVFGRHAVTVKEGMGAGGRGLPRAATMPGIEVAALAIEYGLVLASHDQRLRRLSRLRVVDPLTGSRRLPQP
jgi:hypothetical protein